MNALTFRPAAPPGRAAPAPARPRPLFTARFRVLWVVAAFELVALLALMRIAWIGLVQPGPQQASMAEALLPPRGEIVDRNGVPLARAFPAYALWYDPTALGDGGSPLVKPPAEVARQLVAIFPDMHVKWLTARLASGKAGYLRRRVLPDEANRVHAIGELALEMPQEIDRQYPQGSMAAHVLGFVAAAGHGRVGMEERQGRRIRKRGQARGRGA